jgi:hypothetical protein
MWSNDHNDHFDVVMEHLTEGGGHSSGLDGFWPHLQSITMQSPFATDLSAVSTMISARLAAGLPIRRLTLERVDWKGCSGEVQPAEARSAPSSRHLEQIQELRKMVNVEVTCGRTTFRFPSYEDVD